MLAPTFGGMLTVKGSHGPLDQHVNRHSKRDPGSNQYKLLNFLQKAEG
jgi:hypothetical protein